MSDSFKQLSQAIEKGDINFNLRDNKNLALAKEIRKIRLDNDELLYDMAKRLEVTSACLSGLENGHNPDHDLLNKIIELYNPKKEDKKLIESAYIEVYGELGNKDDVG